MDIRMSIRQAYWRGQSHARRALRGARYAIGRTTKDDASHMLWEAQSLVGCWPLCCVSTGDVLERARDFYADHPALDEICDDAASRVASKWNDSGDSTSAAVDWAMELVERYASERGVDLIKRDEDALDLVEASPW